MRPAEIELLASVSRPSVHPSGTHAVVAVSRPDLTADATVGQLWSVPLDGGEPRRITRGFRDAQPRFSPDGTLLAFLRTTPGGRAQLHFVDARGGEPSTLTDAPLGVDAFDWSPDGRRLVYAARLPEHGRYGTIPGLEPAAEPARRLGTLRYKANGVGYVTDRRSQLFLIPVPPVDAEPAYPAAPGVDAPATPAMVPEPRQLTSADRDHRSPQFSPDGRQVAFVAALHEGAERDLRADLYEIPVEGGEPANATAALGAVSVHAAAYAPDGTLFVAAQALGEHGRDFVGRNAALYRVDAPRSCGEQLTDPEAIDLGEVGSQLTVLDDGRVLAHNRSRGAVRLIAVDPAGEVTSLSAGTAEVRGHDVVAGRIVVSVATADSAGDVAVLENAALRRVTDFSRGLRAAGVLTPQELEVTASDGSVIHGWVVLPDGAGPHPVLLNIHGGPFHHYSVGLFDEAQVYAAAGYSVVMCNPRGSAGYGQAHGRAIRQRMGTVDLSDVLEFLDGALAAHAEVLDPARVGIMGGSYGGYLTAWATAHEHRFAAAIVERGFLDPAAFVGASDIGSYFGQEYVGEQPELIAAQSPQAVVGRVRTPTLVIHSADDLRCPLDQAERYFAALRLAGVESEMLVFPGENHELSRSGRPRHRLQRFEAILEWWARYLPVGERA